MAKKKRKMKAKNFKKIRETEPLLKSGAATEIDSKALNKDMYNRADNTLKNLQNSMGIPRQKVRMK